METSILQFAFDLATKIIKRSENGFSLSVAYREYADSMPISERTLYEYIDKGVFNADNIDLRRKVRRRPSRKKSGPQLKVDRQCHIGRTYADFLAFTDEHPEHKVREMDTVDGKKGGKVILTIFFRECDPQQTNQKSRCERNHEYIRYILPKGSSFDDLTQEDVTLLMNHVNSMPRASLNGKAPVQVFLSLYGEETAAKLGLRYIPLEELHLKPELLKK